MMNYARTLGTILLFCSMPVFATECLQKEYAEYKDQAKTESGRRSMAFEYCTFSARFDSATKLHELASQYGHVADMHSTLLTMQQCNTARSKIANALKAAKNSTKAMEFMLGGCGLGNPPTN